VVDEVVRCKDDVRKDETDVGFQIAKSPLKHVLHDPLKLSSLVTHNSRTTRTPKIAHIAHNSLTPTPAHKNRAQNRT
jgi:hypothetical protein